MIVAKACIGAIKWDGKHKIKNACVCITIPCLLIKIGPVMHSLYVGNVT